MVIGINGGHTPTLARQVYESPPQAAPGIEHAHHWRNVSAQNLIEMVDIILPELFLKPHVPEVPLHAELYRVDAMTPGCEKFGDDE